MFSVIHSCTCAYSVILKNICMKKSISKDCFISMYLVINVLRKFSLCSIIGDHCSVGVYQFYCFPLMYVKLVKYFLLC